VLVKLIKVLFFFFFFSFLYFLLCCCIVSTIRVNKDEYIIRCFIFLPHLTSDASALPEKTRNPKIASIHLNAAYRFANTQNALKYHLIAAELSFIVKTIDCVHQTGPIRRKNSTAIC